jgi:hypothetical protein
LVAPAAIAGARIGVEITMYQSGATVEDGRGRRQVESEWDRLKAAADPVAYRMYLPKDGLRMARGGTRPKGPQIRFQINPKITGTT